MIKTRDGKALLTAPKNGSLFRDAATSALTVEAGTHVRLGYSAEMDSRAILAGRPIVQYQVMN